MTTSFDNDARFDDDMLFTVIFRSFPTRIRKISARLSLWGKICLEQVQRLWRNRGLFRLGRLAVSLVLVYHLKRFSESRFMQARGKK